MANRNAVLLGSSPIRSRAGLRALDKPLAGNTQGPLRAHAGQVTQLTTERIYSIDEDSLEITETALEHPTSSALYYPSATGPSGELYYVSQSKKEVLRYLPGEGVTSVAKTSEDPWKGPSVAEGLAVTPEGDLLYGTTDAKIHRLRPDGTEAEPLELPYQRHGFGFAFAAATSITPGPAGTILAGTWEGPVAFDAAGKAVWRQSIPTARGGADYPVLPTPDGERVYHTGGNSVVGLNAKTGEVDWKYPLGPGEGDCFNAGVVDGEGNLYTSSSKGVVFKIAPDGAVLWRRNTDADPDTDQPRARLELDAWGNLCVNPSTRSFHVYDPDGVPLLKLEAGDGLDAKHPYIFDFTLSQDKTRAVALTVGNFGEERRNTLIEVALPGSSQELLKELRPDAPPGEIVLEDDWVIVAGVPLQIQAP